MEAPRKRSWLRFSLRTLLAFFVATALLFAYLASVWHGHQKKVMLIREVEARGEALKLRRAVRVGLVDSESTTPTETRIFDRVVGVRLKRAEVIDDFLPRLDGFPGLKSLNLSRSGVTNEGMRHVARLTSLEELNLSYTAITDDCMPQIGELVRLRELDLGHTRVCGRGFHRLAALPDLEKLTLVFTPIRDDSLEQLKAIRTLSLCNVWSCRHLSRQGAESFQAARPDCRLSSGDVTDAG